MQRISSCAVSLVMGFALSLPAAAASCAQSQDVTALKTADLQQFLMVAALTCHKVADYNEFVLSHQSELQSSDKQLLRYFMGRSVRTGDDDYNAFKTALANAASLRSLHDAGFCSAADEAFAAGQGRPVARQVAEQPPPINLAYASCQGEDAAPAGPQLEAALDLR